MSEYRKILDPVSETVEPWHRDLRRDDRSVSRNDPDSIQRMMRIATKGFQDFHGKHSVTRPGVDQQAENDRALVRARRGPDEQESPAPDRAIPSPPAPNMTAGSSGMSPVYSIATCLPVSFKSFA